MSIADGPYPDRYSSLDVASQNTDKMQAVLATTKERNEGMKKNRRRRRIP
jgi:hypothetical protein